MRFQVHDLITIIAEKHGLEISNIDFNNLNDSNLPIKFLEEIESIVAPLLTQKSKIEIDSREDIYNQIPKEYIDKIQPIDDDGKKLLSFSELQKLVSDHNNKLINTNENVDLKREKLKASYVHDEYPVMAGLEHSWRLLAADYEIVEREKHPANDPISSFTYFVDLGFYPPPEILMVIQEGFQIYFDSKGLVSLDEVFFGQKYKKTNNLAYKKHRKMKYSFFDIHVKSNNSKKENNNESLEKIMLQAIEETHPITLVLLGFDPNVDIDTFLRGYRRWKKDIKDGKFE